MARKIAREVGGSLGEGGANLQFARRSSGVFHIRMRPPIRNR